MTSTEALIPASPAAEGGARARRLALGAVVGPLLFTLAWLVLGALSPGYTVGGTWISPYSPITQPISGLGLGDTARWMNPAFVLSGVLLLAGVAGVVRALPAGGRASARITSGALLALAPLGLVTVGLFSLDRPAPHLSGAMLVLATPVVSFLVLGLHLRHVPGWRRFGRALLLATPLTLVLFVGYAVSYDQSAVAAGHGVAGLTQRLLFTEILTWFAAMGWRAHTGRNQR